MNSHWINLFVTDDLSVRLVLTLLHFFWQGLAVGILTVFISRLLCRSNSSTRYRLYSISLLMLPVLVVVTYVSLELPMTVPWQVHEPPLTTQGLVSGDPMPVGEFHAGGGIHGSATALLRDPTNRVESSESLSPPDRSETIMTLANVSPAIAVTYAIGVCLMFLRLGCAFWGGHRLQAGATVVRHEPTLQLVADQSRHIGLRFVPLIKYCDLVVVPTVIGVIRPIILLPIALSSGLSSDQLAAIIGHELAHIRRLDLLMNLTQRVIESVLFFHPVVWYLSRRVDSEREACCDDLVIGSGCTRLEYAGALLRMAELCVASRRAPIVTLAASGYNTSQLEIRIERMMNNPRGHQFQLTRAGVFLFTLAFASVVLMPGMLEQLVHGNENNPVPSPSLSTRGVESRLEDQGPSEDDNVDSLAAFEAQAVLVLSHEYSIRNGGKKRTELVVLQDGWVIAASDHRNRQCRIKLSPNKLTSVVDSIRATGFSETFADGQYFFAPGDSLDLWDRSFDWIQLRTRQGVHKLACGYGWEAGTSRHNPSAVSFLAAKRQLQALVDLTRAGGTDEVSSLIATVNRGLKREFPDQQELNAAHFTHAEYFPSGSRIICFDRESRGDKLRVCVEKFENGKAQVLSVELNQDRRDVEPAPVLHGLDLGNFGVERWTSSDVYEKRALREGESPLNKNYDPRAGFTFREAQRIDFGLWIHSDQNVFYVEHSDGTRRKVYGPIKGNPEQRLGVTEPGRDISKEDSTQESSPDDAVIQLLVQRAAEQKRRPFGKPKFHTVNNQGRVTAVMLKRIKLKKGDMLLIGRLRHLERLDLSSSTIKDKELVFLQPVQSLRELTLFDTSISSAGLSHIADMEMIERLNIGDTKVADDGIVHLNRMKGLRHLSLSRCRITNGGVKQLATASSLVSLKLGETKITDAAIPDLLKLKDLRGLTLDQTKITHEGLAKIAERAQFKWLASPRATIEELARRMENSEFEEVAAMRSVGLLMPKRGTFHLKSIDSLEQTSKDIRLGRERFRLEMEWFHEPDRIDDVLYAEISVDHGTVVIEQLGVVRPKNKDTVGAFDLKDRPGQIPAGTSGVVLQKRN